MSADRETALPLLLQAAAAFALTFALALPLGVMAAVAAIGSLAWRNGLALLPFLLAGRLAASCAGVDERGDSAWSAHAAPMAPMALELPFHGLVRITRPSRSIGAARRSTRIDFETASDRARARATGALLLEPASAAPRRTGASLLVRGTLRPAGPPRNPGQRGEQARLLAERVTPAPGGGLRRLRAAVEALADGIELRLRERLTPATAALAGALAIGRTEGLDPGFKSSLRAIGAWHFLAVSGSHVALVAALAAALLARMRVHERVRVPAILLLVVGYAFLAGGEAPALRAVIGCVGAGLVLGRRRLPSSISWLAAAFLLLGAIEPGVASEAGLQLSFVAVLALSVAARFGAARSPKGSGTGIDLGAPLLRAGRFALAAGIATAPLTAWHFGSVAFLAPLATLLLGPVVALGLTLALLATVTCALPAFCTRLFELPLAAVDAILKSAAQLGDRLPATPFLVAAPPQLVVVLLVASWLALLARRPLLALALIAAAVIGSWTTPPRLPSLTLLSTGHGQAALLRDEARCDLFDAGGDGALSADQLVRALHELGVGRLDRLFVSHLDADHAGFVPAVVAEFEVAALLLPESARAEIEMDAPPTATIAAVRDAARTHGVPVRFLAAGDREGGAAVLWPPPRRSFGARNDGSLVLRVGLAGGRTLLLPGDLEGFPLLEAAAGVAGPVDVLLLPHHGNADPGLSALIERARPELILVSREERSLPGTSLAALRRCGRPWLTTGAGGAIQWQPTGEIRRGALCR